MSALSVPGQFRGFEVLEFVSLGLSGEVYKARSLDNGKIVALKVFGKKHDKTVLGYCINEQTLLREVTHHRQHPYIVEYVTSDASRLPYFLATHYIEGARALETLLNRPLPPGFVLGVVEQIGSALDYLHYGHPELSPIVHRDIKPHNILIDGVGNAILIDLSIACQPHFSTPEEHGLGTPQYMAPEQYDGAEVPATDQFALASVALQMLVGRTLLPRGTKTAFKRLSHLHKTQYRDVRRQLGLRTRTAEVIVRALQFEPAQRYASCEEFAYELRQALIADRQPVVGNMPVSPDYGGSTGFMVICGIVTVAVIVLLAALTLNGVVH